ncbi:MAG TPA: hypothetical protein VK438_16115 [Xanthobacteraceae bacterium]|nr:hypothetical protein [Xanthobacteraceae bacterium]
MKDLERALADITAIRSQLARGTQFRGYGPVTVAAGGLLAVLAAALQALTLPDAVTTPLGYLALWIGMAAAAVVLAGAEMIARARRVHGGLADEMLYAAAEQYIPAGVAGTLITVVLYRYAPHALVLLPGLWQIVFSLGVFASCRALPRAMFAVGVWYLAAGLVALALSEAAPLSPLVMGVPFGVGQLMMAVVLYRATGEQDGEE